MQPAIRNFALVFVGALLFHLAGTWTLPLIDRDEPRFAEASREMMDRRDYVVPYFNEQYRFDKPPLTYWAQIASYRVFGENDFAARFPTAIAAALTAVAVLAWGRRIGGETLGLLGAVIFTTCVQVFIHGKAAVADMWLVLFMTIAARAGWEILRAGRTQLWWWTFYVALALGFLAKGPIAWLPVVAVGSMRWFAGERQVARRFLFVPGLLVTLGIVALWGVPALIRTHGEFLQVGIGKHVVARSIGTMEGHGAASLAGYIATLPFYFVTVFLSFFPWSIKLPWLAKRLWSGRDKTDAYVIACTLVVFVVFTIVKTKLLHYTLPAFPLMSLLLARHMVESGRTRFALVAGTSMAVVCLAAALLLFPIASRSFPSPQLFRMARADLRPEMEFGAVEFTEPSLVWYFRGAVRGWFSKLDASTARIFMEAPGARFIVVPTALAAKLYPTLPANWKRYDTTGVNFVKGKRVSLTLLLKPS